MNWLTSMLSDGTNGSISSKRVVTLLAFVICSGGFIASVVGYRGLINFDRKMPDGSPRKLMDSAKLRNLGWTPKIQLEQGLLLAYQDWRK